MRSTYDSLLPWRQPPPWMYMSTGVGPDAFAGR